MGLEDILMLGLKLAREVQVSISLPLVKSLTILPRAMEAYLHKNRSFLFLLKVRKAIFLTFFLL